jgi:hypothetical protein
MTIATDRVRRARDLLTKILVDAGENNPDLALTRAARRVVWERSRPDGDWDGLKNAIGELEDIVGRPASEGEI